MASCFQSWTLYKPVTSRPCNSEWYFLGRSAHLDRRHVIQHLKTIRDMYEKDPEITFDTFLSENSLNESLLALQSARCIKQVNALKEVITFCKDYETMNLQDLWESNREKTVRWCMDLRMPTEYKLK
jgi:hypothetical protein